MSTDYILDDCKMPTNKELSQTFGKLLVVSFVSLVVLTLVTFLTYGWASNQMSNTHNGISLNINSGLLKNFSKEEGGQYAILDEEDHLIGANDVFMPGSSIEYEIGFLNLDNPSLTIEEFVLDVPTIWESTSGVTYDANTTDYDENPIQVSGTSGVQYYYFGEQLSIRIKGYTIYDNAYTNGELTLDDANATYYNADSSGGISSKVFYLTAEDLEDTSAMAQKSLLLQDISMVENQAIVLHLVIQFENTTYDQSEFMRFGYSTTEGGIGGRCARTISTIFKTF